MPAITVKRIGPTNHKPDRLKVQRADYKRGMDADRWKPITISCDGFHYLQRDREYKGLQPLPFKDSKEYALYLYLNQICTDMTDKSWFGQWVRANLSEDVTVFTLIHDTRIVTIGVRLYQIVRYYQNSRISRRVILKGLTLDEARKHCSNPENSSSTATGSEAVARTRRVGAWFDGYEQM